MIVIDSVTKRFARARRAPRPALDAVSLEFDRGMVHAVVGPNGAGKSTLFGLVLGFIHPSSGDLTIDGDDPRDYVRRNGAGYLPERFTLPAGWRVGEALRGLASREQLGAAAGPACRAALERFGLASHEAARAGSLSRGLLQRVGLAQALLAPRALVVLDEPTEGLDPEWRLRFRNEIDRLRADGRTVLLASHDLAEVERLADRVVVLEAGRVRESFAVHAPPSALKYDIEIDSDTPDLAALFPGAARTQDAAHVEEAARKNVAAAESAAARGGGTGAVYRVSVADVAELNARLAALLATGARVRALRPAAEPLEARVRRALGGGSP
jgi:ABC-2 type transport system ATP-binding protein